MPITATIVINLALLAYSVGVWSERLQGRLKGWHLAFFWCGLAFDTWGTGLMFEFVGGLTYDVHGLSGLLAIVLMLLHALWASLVLWRGDERQLRSFHRLSVAVWAVWLVPYFSPMVFAMTTPARAAAAG